MNTRNLYGIIKLGSFLMVAGTSACTWSDPVQVEQDFGKSVRHMVEQQIDSPATAAKPAIAGPEFLDGDSAINSIGRYRQSQKKPPSSDAPGLIDPAN